MDMTLTERKLGSHHVLVTCSERGYVPLLAAVEKLLLEGYALPEKEEADGVIRKSGDEIREHREFPVITVDVRDFDPTTSTRCQNPQWMRYCLHTAEGTSMCVEGEKVSVQPLAHILMRAKKLR